MAERISQLNLDYDAVEDRLLMSVTTTGRQEYRIWLTRRFLDSLWPVLLKVLEADPAVSQQAEPVTRQAVLSIRHEQAVSATNFSKPYAAEEVSRPHGDRPLLVSTAKLRPVDDGGAMIGFETSDGRDVQLATNARLLHSLCSLLTRVSHQAGWKLGLEVGHEPMPAVTGPLN